MAFALKIQNVYGDFFRSFKSFIDDITRETINKYEFNYGAKPLEYYRMINNESFEFPTCMIEISDIQPMDGVSPIARNAGMKINYSPHNVKLAENITQKEKIYIDKRFVRIMFNVIINTEDVVSLLNYHDLML